MPAEARRQYNRPTWHNINLPFFLSEADRDALRDRLEVNTSAAYPGDTPRDAYNVLQAIQHAQATLSSRAGPKDKAVAYCWLFHLVGDVHQPLHTTALFTVEQFPNGDRGGNSIPLMRGRNLHALWDNFLGRQHYLRDVDREVAELATDARFRDIWTSAAEVQEPTKWAAEGHALCESFVYSSEIRIAVQDTPSGADLAPVELPVSYMREAGKVARMRVIAAGIRLAVLLGATPTEVSGTRDTTSAAAFVEVPSEKQKYWLNLGSNVRHNATCKWFANTVRGRYCEADEGRPCGECGG